MAKGTELKIKRKITSREKNEFLWGWAFILPTMIGLIVLNIYPIIKTIYESFFKTGDFGKGNIFIGLANYQRVLTDPEVWQSLLNTFKYAIVEVPFSIIIALVLAVLLNRKMKGRAAYRTIFFLPMVAAPAAIAMVWRWLFNSEFGLLNNVFGTNINWISNPNIAVYSIGVIGVWSIIGYNMVLFLSGLQEIPKDYYEASNIDGASGIYQFFHITVPLLSPTIFFVTVTRVIGALQVFDLIFMVMDRNNPALSKTQSLVYLFYQYSFVQNNKGLGSTIVVVLLAIIMIITVFQMKAQKKWVYYKERGRRNMEKKKKAAAISIHVVLILVSITMLVPFIWMALTAFKTSTEATSVNPFVIFPAVWQTDNFKTVIDNMNFLQLYINTILLIVGRVAAAVLTAPMAAYAFARLNFKGKNFMFSLVLFQMMVPGQIFIIPQYLMVSKMGLLDTVFALIFPGLVTAFGTFLLRQAYLGLPKDLEEAARLDGCNIGQTFLYIMAPLTRSGMVALGIFTAVFAYKDLMWPMICNKTVMPLSAALAKMQGQYTNNYPQLMAASLLACVPMIVIYLIFQKQFIEGIATSGGKL